MDSRPRVDGSVRFSTLQLQVLLRCVYQVGTETNPRGMIRDRDILSMSESDKRADNGYSFVRKPSPAPGLDESPFITWGDIPSRIHLSILVVALMGRTTTFHLHLR
ncbi:hypothetical protein AALP_AA6G154200 [Arabis alpina]|uniref:Uncharacterized protein n=1 Tax=Arabis alpina TaxID=50452 RepID=A0A087GPE7_ARAAL|nr:hypothetical protein AALP_AA6G154200 [Arabis alpina]